MNSKMHFFVILFIFVIGYIFFDIHDHKLQKSKLKE